MVAIPRTLLTTPPPLMLSISALSSANFSRSTEITTVSLSAASALRMRTPKLSGEPTRPISLNTWPASSTRVVVSRSVRRVSRSTEPLTTMKHWSSLLLGPITLAPSSSVCTWKAASTPLDSGPRMSCVKTKLGRRKSASRTFLSASTLASIMRRTLLMSAEKALYSSMCISRTTVRSMAQADHTTSPLGWSCLNVSRPHTPPARQMSLLSFISTWPSLVQNTLGNRVLVCRLPSTTI
mmetsp:Transcript_53383/g.169712  ORF Transcript_53383/g.169712 Transcript_53383/m.169712 type:complete len:238 (-) Transcript_53383:2075-2788(-)